MITATISDAAPTATVASCANTPHGTMAAVVSAAPTKSTVVVWYSPPWLRMRSVAVKT